MSICSIPGCDKPEVAKGLCAKHYQQARRNNKIEVFDKPKVCTHPGCNEKVHAKGLCRKHYNQLRRKR